MHSLLARQLRKCFGTERPPSELTCLVNSVDSAYREFDSDRSMLERSMEISSQELLHANAELRAVLAAFPDLFIWVDPTGRIVNTKAGDPNDLYLSPKRLIGKSLASFPVEEIGRKFSDALSEVRANGRQVMIEYEVAIGDGTSVYDARLFPLLDGQILAIIRNITDTRRVELAEAANREKSVFLANMSHELRTPLHGILSFARFGVKRIEGDRSKLLKYFTQIGNVGQSLLSLLNDLLDIAKLEAGGMEFAFAPADLRQLLAVEIDQIESLLSERDITLHHELPQGALPVVVDSQKIRQVIRNVVGNAVKFSPIGGTIDVRSTCSREQVTVTISDQGPGVPETELERIFEKFVQSSATSTGAGGTGLGLSICREIIVGHAGRIWVENIPEGGSRFTFELPLSIESPIGSHAGSCQ
jgi:signal transduction histidine kinase